MGQPALAAAVAFSQAAASALGTFPFTDKWTPVTVQPASTFSIVTVAVVARFSATRFAAPNCPERAMVKQPAWAAAISSSGFVPFPFSNLVLNEYCDSAQDAALRRHRSFAGFEISLPFCRRIPFHLFLQYLLHIIQQVMGIGQRLTYFSTSNPSSFHQRHPPSSSIMG